MYVGDTLKIKEGLYFHKIGVGARPVNSAERTTVAENGWHLQSFGDMLKETGNEGVSLISNTNGLKMISMDVTDKFITVIIVVFLVSIHNFAAE